MITELTCIVCPNSCEIRVETDENGKIKAITGNLCMRGGDYAVGEMTHPVRTFATSCLVVGGELPLVSVRVNKPIPKELVTDAVKELKKVTLTAPVKVGQVVISDLFGTGADVIATKNVGTK